MAIETTETETEMDQYTAVMVAEGAIAPEGDTVEEQEEYILRAWQVIIDSGIVWQLQGYFGRTAHDLIQQGLCAPAQVPA